MGVANLILDGDLKDGDVVEELLTEGEFGFYAPTKKTRFLRFLVALGLSRGKLTKWIRKGWLDLHGPIVDAEVRGVRYRFDLRDNVTDSKVLLSSREYDRREIQALTETAGGRTFVDVGANTGYYTLSLLERGAAQVIAMEPNPPTLERLLFNLKINKASDRVTVIEEGVGPEGELEFFQTAALGSASFVKPGEDSPSLRVRTRPMLAMLIEAGVETVGSLKIDVEGFEDRALIPFLQNAPERLLPETVVMEVCNSSNWDLDPIELFTLKGYRLLQETRGNLILRRDTAWR